MKNNDCSIAGSSPSEGPSRVGRRSFLAAAAGVTVAGSAFAQDSRYDRDAPPVRYPDPDVVALDNRFARHKIGNASIQRLHTGMRWAEGPAWNGVGRYLVWSDIPNNVQHRWLDEDGHVGAFRRPAGNSNGNTFDWEGRQISCQHGARNVVRYEHSGAVTVLAATWQSKPFNAPNDVVVHPDGGIWFTDPGYGILGNYEGDKAELQIKEAVYRIDAKTGKLDLVTNELSKPNGLCFSPDYKKLYVADTGGGPMSGLSVWDVVDGRQIRNGRAFGSTALQTKTGELKGGYDGIRADTTGNIWAGAGWAGAGYDGVHVFAPDGQRIGQILLPEICSNVCFGGPKRNRLFMTASQSLYAVYVEAQGAHIA